MVVVFTLIVVIFYVFVWVDSDSDVSFLRLSGEGLRKFGQESAGENY